MNPPPHPAGHLCLQLVAQPRDTNSSGDISGGWLLSQMDTASSALAYRVAQGRVATVAVSEMSFLRPIPVGAIISCYGEVLNIGRSSLRILTEVWCNDGTPGGPSKITEGEFVFVAIDSRGNTRAIPDKGSDQRVKR